ncbi:MAG: TorF family putative porin [Brevundimonas sp.]|uniref:TorF family putative porin n=1 Tax=Brevundimonas sp. TaxID=1871086 RepID=UPI00391B62D3
MTKAYFGAACIAAITSVAVSAISPSSAQAQSTSPTINWSGELGIASEYVGKGLGKSDGDPSIFGGVQAAYGSFYAKVWASTADLPQGSTAEIVSSIGYKTRWAGNGLNFSVVNRDLPGTRSGIDSNFFEFQGDISRRMGPVNTRLRVNYTPDGFSATEEAWWIELNGSVNVAQGTTVSAAVANRMAENGADYNAWNIGVTRTLVENLALDVRWYDTDGHFRSPAYDGRLVAALTASF